MVRLFSESVQSHPGRDARRWAHRDSVIPLVLVARLCIAHLVWMEISKLHYLANRTFVAAANLFSLPETNRRGAALFRSHTIAAVCNVGVVLWLDCGFAFRHAR